MSPQNHLFWGQEVKGQGHESVEGMIYQQAIHT